MNLDEGRKALELIPYALYVVGVGKGAQAGAYAANWICQASFEPPLLMLGVKRGTRHHALIESVKVLVVNFLHEGQAGIAANFFRWRDAKNGRLGKVAFATGVTGAPILAEAPAYAECRLRRMLRGGDHDVAVAEVIEAVVRREGKPLLMSQTEWSYAG